MAIDAVAGRPEGRTHDRAHLLRFWLGRLYIALAILIVLGLAANFTSTVYLQLAFGRPPYVEFFEHLQFCLLGLGCAWLVNQLITATHPAKRWLRIFIPIAFAIALVLVALVRLSPLGVTEFGARRWLDLFGLRFQPSELLKVALVLYLAQLLCWWRKTVPPATIAAGPSTAGDQHRAGPAKWWQIKLQRAARPIFPEMPKRCTLIILLSIGLTAIQPDLGTTGVILGAATVTLMLAGVRFRDLAVLYAIIIGIGLAGMVAAPDFYNYAEERLATWVNPTANDDSTAYQITQSRGALAVGGLTGRGYLQGEQKVNRLPLSTKDFIYPVMVEELGYIGGVGIILVFLYLAWIGTRLSSYCRDPFSQTAIAALGFAIALQALVNIGTTTGTLPLSGLTLPFLSSGGTSLVVSICTIGLMAALARGELLEIRRLEEQTSTVGNLALGQR